MGSNSFALRRCSKIKACVQAFIFEQFEFAWPKENCRSLGSARADKGRGSLRLVRMRQAVPPLRFAPVGMTMLTEGEDWWS